MGFFSAFSEDNFTFINGEEINLQNKVLMFSFSLNT